MSSARRPRAPRLVAGMVLLAALPIAGGSCVDLTALAPFPCAKDGTCPNDFVCVTESGCVAPGSCDPVLQDCAKDGAKCGAIEIGGPGAIDSVCIDDGEGALGAPCARVAFGIDDCAAGGFCNATLGYDGSFVCRPFCDAQGDCAPAGGCVAVFGTEPYGVCAPLCTPGASACADGRSCKTLGGVGAVGLGICYADGEGGPGANCDLPDDCAAGLSCFGVCIASCSVAAGCGPGATCKVAGGGYGRCVCDLFGSYCGGGTSCQPVAAESGGYTTACKPFGTTPVGGACDTQSDCQAGTACWGSATAGFCRAFCDGAHACDPDDRFPCIPLPGTGAGVCAPS